jgi:uncharacterized protein with LGFP repeats
MMRSEPNIQLSTFNGPLGLPIGNELPVPGVGGALFQVFQNGSIYQAPGMTQAFAVVGSIYNKYIAAGGPSGYGLPTTDASAFGGVQVQFFSNDTSAIMSASLESNVPAYLVYGDILGEWRNSANETDVFGQTVQSVLGTPKGDEEYIPGMGTGPNGAGVPEDPRMNTFENGVIYWGSLTKAHAIYGILFAAYRAFLGLPLSDEVPAPVSGVSGTRSQLFANGVIYKPPGFAAFSIGGQILAYLETRGGTPGQLGGFLSEMSGSLGTFGAPIDIDDTGTIGTFQNGVISFHASLTPLEWSMLQVGGDLYVSWACSKPVNSVRLSSDDGTTLQADHLGANDVHRFQPPAGKTYTLGFDLDPDSGVLGWVTPGSYTMK